MSHLRISSISEWIKKLQAETIFAYMIGASPNNIPSLGSHYDFINRLWFEENPASNQDSLRSPRRKPRKKLGKNQKQPPRHPGIVQKLVDKALQGRTLKHRPELLMQNIFASIAVLPYASKGLLGDTQKLDVTGDGTCIKSGATPYGIKVCDCKNKGIYNCDCKRRFSDYEANWGWDSYHELWYYGFTGYFLSVYNSSLKTDLPIYLRLVQASHHDSVSAVISLVEARSLYSDFVFHSFLSDSASDNYPTYQLLNEWNIIPFIALNERASDKFKLAPPINVDNLGRPICLADLKMVNWGYDKKRRRIK